MTAREPIFAEGRIYQGHSVLSAPPTVRHPTARVLAVSIPSGVPAMLPFLSSNERMTTGAAYVQ
jgi:hypothetical protein